MWRNRFAFAAGIVSAVFWPAQPVMAADLFEPPPEAPPAYLPPPPPPAAYIVPPPPVVVYSFMKPFPYGGAECGSFPGYPYYIPCTNRPASYYRPYYNHHLGLETDCGPCGAPGVAPGWGGYGYK